MTGLVIAEIELHHQLEAFKRSPWLGSEVTGQLPIYESIGLPFFCQVPLSTSYE